MKRNYYFVAVVALLFFLSCRGGEDNVIVPSGIIPPDTLVFVLADFHLVEAAVLEKQLQKADTDPYANYYYQAIFDKYKINRKRFNEAMVFYSSHPKLYRETYDKVLEELSRMQTESMQ